jgi:hypothetical protein
VKLIRAKMLLIFVGIPDFGRQFQILKFVWKFDSGDGNSRLGFGNSRFGDSRFG